MNFRFLYKYYSSFHEKILLNHLFYKFFNSNQFIHYILLFIFHFTSLKLFLLYLWDKRCIRLKQPDINYLFFVLRLFLFSNLQKKLFTKITYSNKKNDKDNIFFKKYIFGINQFKYKKNKLSYFIKILNNIIPFKINLKDFFFFLILIFFLLFIRFFNKFLRLNLKSCKFIYNTIVNLKTIKQLFYLTILYNYILMKYKK